MAAAGEGDRAADEAAVRALHAGLVAGWNAGSGECFAAPFWEDAGQVAFDGTWLEGQAAIARFHGELLAGPWAGSRLASRVHGVRFLSADVAIVRATGGPAASGQPDEAAERQSLPVYVAERRSGRWGIATLQNVRAPFRGRREDAVRLMERLRRLLGSTG